MHSSVERDETTPRSVVFNPTCDHTAAVRKHHWRVLAALAVHEVCGLMMMMLLLLLLRLIVMMMLILVVVLALLLLLLLLLLLRVMLLLIWTFVMMDLFYFILAQKIIVKRLRCD